LRVCFLSAGILLALCGGPATAAEQGQLDASASLFSVLAAINAAGYDADPDSPANHPLRDAVRKELASKRIACLDELKDFFREHRKKDWTAELSQYVSFALVVDGPPAFAYRLKQNELPPDVLELDGFQPLLARFYREADLGSLWEKAQPDYEAAIARYHAPVVRAVNEVSGYLRADATGIRGWRFQIFVDLIGAPNQIQTRSYGSEYFVVVTPSPEPQVGDVRHAYLHYHLDPLATRFADDLEKKKAVGDYALGAPYLEEAYKSDFLLLATESLIKAVESRLQPGSGPQKQALVQRALGEGFILAPHFAEQLALYETQDSSMRLFYQQMIASIDFRKEERRLANVEFATERPVRRAKEAPVRKALEPVGAEKSLLEAEQLYTERQLGKAKEAYLRLLRETSDAPLQAKAYYGLARIAALEKQPEVAEKLFQRVLASSPDPQTGAWAHVYLGRLAELAGEKENAAEHYRTAAATPGASAAAREAAQKNLQEGFTKD
jgi:TolA-binding protein